PTQPQCVELKRRADGYAVVLNTSRIDLDGAVHDQGGGITPIAHHGVVDSHFHQARDEIGDGNTTRATVLLDQHEDDLLFAANAVYGLPDGRIVRPVVAEGTCGSASSCFYQRKESAHRVQVTRCDSAGVAFGDAKRDLRATAPLPHVPK